MRSKSKRWTASGGWHTKKDSNGKSYEYYSAGIGDDDFTYDGLLSVSGDFGGDAKGKYAKAIADNLNAIPELRLLLQNVASFLALSQSYDPCCRPITEPLLKRIVSLYPMLHDFPVQSEPTQNAEQLVFHFRFKWTEEEIRERDKRAKELSSKRHLRSCSTLDEFLAEIESKPGNKEKMDLVRRLIRQRQIPLNWDDDDNTSTNQ